MSVIVIKIIVMCECIVKRHQWTVFIYYIRVHADTGIHNRNTYSLAGKSLFSCVIKFYNRSNAVH